MISKAEAIRPATAAAIASSDRRCAVDVRAAATALSVERKSAKWSRTAASCCAPSWLTNACRVAAGLSRALLTPRTPQSLTYLAIDAPSAMARRPPPAAVGARCWHAPTLLGDAGRAL